MNDEAIIRWLRAHPLFVRLPAQAIARVASRLSVRDFAAGETLIRQGAPGTEVLLLVEGEVSVRLRRRDDEIVLASAGPGAVLGEMALVTGAPRNASVVATRAGSALVLGAAEFHDLARSEPELVDVLTSIVAERLGRAAQDGLGDKVLEGFRIIRPVGRGATAVVYAAERLAEGANVALKMMSHVFARDTDAIARFDREAELLAGLSHPAITRCHGRFLAYGTVFLVMDFVDGASLDDVIWANGALPIGEVTATFATIATALDYVHRSGVVHRDIKPANVLLHRSGQPSLTDFGVAERVRSAGAAAEATLICGTPQYMSPELFLGTAPSVESDLYALGCLVFEMAAGRPLFDAPSVAALFQAKRSFDPASIKDTAPFAGTELGAAIASLLEADPGARRLDAARWQALAGGVAAPRVKRAATQRAAAMAGAAGLEPPG